MLKGLLLVAGTALGEKKTVNIWPHIHEHNPSCVLVVVQALHSFHTVS